MTERQDFTRDVLLELDDRLRRASVELEGLIQRAAALHNTSEYDRIYGKRQGVELSRDYLRGMIP